jgi:hypothetical protein
VITLTIFRKDGTVYWTENFNDTASAQAWITEEQTRPYWDQAWTYTIQTPPAPTQAEVTAQAMAQVRAQRDSLIDGSRWIKQRHQDEQELGVATSLSSETYQAWLNYWQQLRALPDQPGFDPTNVTWPTQPPVKG